MAVQGDREVVAFQGFNTGTFMYGPQGKKIKEAYHLSCTPSNKDKRASWIAFMKKEEKTFNFWAYPKALSEFFSSSDDPGAPNPWTESHCGWQMGKSHAVYSNMSNVSIVCRTCNDSPNTRHRSSFPPKAPPGQTYEYDTDEDDGEESDKPRRKSAKSAKPAAKPAAESGGARG